MAWIESHTVFLRHRKLLELAKDLRLKPVYCMGHLHALFHVALEQQEDGDLSSWTDTFIAESSAYLGDVSQYVSLLQKHKWLDGRLLYDWLDYVGLYLTKKYSTSNIQRLREIWAKHGRSYGQNKTSERLVNEQRTVSFGGGFAKEKEVYPLVSPLASPLLSPYQEKEKRTPPPPLQGGMFENSGGLPKNQTANGLSPGGRSAQTTAGNPEKVPKNTPSMVPVNPAVSNSLKQHISLLAALQTPKNGSYADWFEGIWKEYPASARFGKKLAFRHFQTSVKVINDFVLLKRALLNYLTSKRVKNGYVQNASTWFNNWRDWLDYKEPESSVYDEDLVRDRVTGEVQHDPITGEALRVKRDPVTGKVIGSQWYTRPSIAQATK